MTDPQQPPRYGQHVTPEFARANARIAGCGYYLALIPIIVVVIAVVVVALVLIL